MLAAALSPSTNQAATDTSTSTSGIHRVLFISKTLHTALTTQGNVAYALSWSEMANSIKALGAFVLAYSISLHTSGHDPYELQHLLGDIHEALVTAINLHQFAKCLGSLRALVYEVSVLTKLESIVQTLKRNLRQMQDVSQQLPNLRDAFARVTPECSTAIATFTRCHFTPRPLAVALRSMCAGCRIKQDMTAIAHAFASSWSVACHSTFSAREMIVMAPADKGQSLVLVFLDNDAPAAATQALLAAAAGQMEEVPMGLKHEYQLLAQDADLASTEDSERLYLQQVVLALASFLDPERLTMDRDAQLAAAWQAAEVAALQANKSLDAIPEAFICPISHEIMLDPCTIETGMTYDRASISNWFRRRRALGMPLTCPNTNTVVTTANANPDPELKQRIHAWLAQQENSIRELLIGNKRNADLEHSLQSEPGPEAVLPATTESMVGSEDMQLVRSTSRAAIDMRHEYISAMLEADLIHEPAVQGPLLPLPRAAAQASPKAPPPGRSHAPPQQSMLAQRAASRASMQVVQHVSGNGGSCAGAAWQHSGNAPPQQDQHRMPEDATTRRSRNHSQSSSTNQASAAVASGNPFSSDAAIDTISRGLDGMCLQHSRSGTYSGYAGPGRSMSGNHSNTFTKLGNAAALHVRAGEGAVPTHNRALSAELLAEFNAQQQALQEQQPGMAGPFPGPGAPAGPPTAALPPAVASVFAALQHGAASGMPDARWLAEQLQQHTNVEAMLAAGMVPRFAAALQQDDQAAAAHAATLLTLIANSSYRLKSAFGQKGALLALLRLLRSGAAELQTQAATALAVLAINHPDNKALMMDSDVVPATIALLTSHWDGCRAQAAALITQLASSTQHHKDKIVEAHAIPALLHLLDTTVPASLNCRSHAAAALKSLATSEGARRAVLAEGGVKTLTGLLQSDMEACQEQAASVFAALAGTSGPHRVGTPASTGALVKVLSFSQCSSTREAAAVALRKLAVSDPATKQCVVGAGADKAVLKLLRGSLASGRTQDELVALRQLAAVLAQR